MSSFFDFNRPKMFDVKKKLGIVEKEEKNDTSSHGTFLFS